MPEATAFGDRWRTRAPDGLMDWTETSDYNQDYAAGAIDATLWPLLGKAVALIVRPDEAVRSAVTNPAMGAATRYSAPTSRSTAPSANSLRVPSPSWAAAP